jgi:hypothetical protein
MNVIEEMALARSINACGRWIDTPIWPEKDLMQFLAKQLLTELRKSGVTPDAETTRALAAYQTWVAAQR